MNRLLALLLICLVTGVFCCGVNEQACGSACYVPGQYSCYDNSLLCPTGWDVCQGQCYNPSVYDCVQTLQYNLTTFQYIYQLCPEGYLNCGEGCYDPNVYTCFDQYNGYMCVNGYDICGTACYDPSVYQCVHSYVDYVCPVGYSSVCNGTCVSDDTPCASNTSPLVCCTDPVGCTGSNYIPCPGSLTCCELYPIWESTAGGYCYDSTESVCSSCPVYNPNHPVYTICPSNAPICCENGCYSSSEQCCHTFGTYDSFLCPTSDTCCGVNNVPEAACCASGTTCYGDTASTTPYCA